MDAGLYSVDIEDIRFSAAFEPSEMPMASNARMPIILIERPDHYELLDGWNRTCALITAGAEEATAIIVSEEDLGGRAGGDDEGWNRSMWEKYAPRLSYRSGH